MRTYTHIVDTKAIKRTLNSIPDHWVVRELSERDYGIDLMIEIFEARDVDHNGHTTYETTGRVCYLQIKGTNTALDINGDQTISFPLDKKSLLYVEKFPVPFLLVRVCTLEGKEGVYFVWLQRYIVDVLDIENPDWRDDKQETHSIRIPLKNNLPTETDKVERIAARIKYIEEHAEFYERYSLMQIGYDGMIKGKFTPEQFDTFISELKRIRTFSTLLTYNSCQVNEGNISDLIQYITEVKAGNEKPESKEDFGDPLLFNLDMLLTDNFMRMAMENMVAENESDTVY